MKQDRATSKSRTTYNESARREYQSQGVFLFCICVLHMLAYGQSGAKREFLHCVSSGVCWTGYHQKLVGKDGKARCELLYIFLSFYIAGCFLSFSVLTMRASHLHHDPARSKPVFLYRHDGGGEEGRCCIYTHISSGSEIPGKLEFRCYIQLYI